VMNRRSRILGRIIGWSVLPPGPEEQDARNHEYNESRDRDPVAPREVAVNATEHDEDRRHHCQQGGEWMRPHSRHRQVPPISPSAPRSGAGHASRWRLTDPGARHRHDAREPASSTGLHAPKHPSQAGFEPPDPVAPIPACSSDSAAILFASAPHSRQCRVKGRNVIELATRSEASFDPCDRGSRPTALRAATQPC